MAGAPRKTGTEEGMSTTDMVLFLSFAPSLLDDQCIRARKCVVPLGIGPAAASTTCSRRHASNAVFSHVLPLLFQTIHLASCEARAAEGGPSWTTPLQNSSRRTARCRVRIRRIGRACQSSTPRNISRQLHTFSRLPLAEERPVHGHISAGQDESHPSASTRL